jgi:peptidoglycan/LPS O-acetylase OafA/YrhL
MMKFLNIKLEDRNLGLDVMRSLAILIVVFGHYISFFNNQLIHVIPFSNTSIRRFLNFVITGFDGVDLFFVLSGFLIGHSLLKTFSQNKLDFKYLVFNFWIKRWFRTLPNYFFVLLLLIILPVFWKISIETPISNISYAKYFIFFQNFLQGEIAFFPESWSLSVEEWFYVLFPLVLTLTSIMFFKVSNKKFFLLAVIVSYIFIGTLLRLGYSSTHPLHSLEHLNKDIRTAVIMRFDAIIYGVLMAYIKMFYSEVFEKRSNVFFIFGLSILISSFILVFILDSFLYAYSFYYSFVGVGLSCLIPFFYNLKLKRRFLIELFTFISVISYSIYLVNYSLVQQSINYLFIDGGILKSVFKFCFASFLTICLSLILYKFIETPFMNVRRKILSNK